MSKKNRHKEKLANRKTAHKLRILWCSNAVWSKSGYGNQSRDLLFRFLKDGWAVAQSAFYGLEGGVIDYQGLRMYPKMASAWGEDGAVMHGQDWNADITICFQDSWVMDVNALSQMRRYTPYLPVDHDPVPPGVLERVAKAYRIITYSKFGQKALLDRGFNSTCIPHGVDTAVFAPLQRVPVREKYGIPSDLFIFGMVSDNKDNPPRKQFQRIMDGFKLFTENHPKSGMYFHAILNQQGGFPIHEYAKQIGISEKIFFSPPYQLALRTDNQQVAEIQNMFDCLVCASAGEGFGMPITEAQSCGVPVIVTDHTAMPELIIEGETGFAVNPGYKRFSPLLSYVAEPDPRDIHEAMEKIFKMDQVKTSKSCRDHILAEYDIVKIVANMWSPLFEEIETEIYGG